MLQVQGRFLRTSENEDLFIGMEVPQAVTLGVVTRALSRVILGVVRALLSHIKRPKYQLCGSKHGIAQCADALMWHGLEQTCRIASA